MEHSTHFGEWNNTGRKRDRQSSTSSLFRASEFFGNDPDEEKPHNDFSVPQKVHYKAYWKHNEDAVYWIRLSRAPNEVICNHHLRHSAGDSIDRVISQNGDRVIFERLTTPRPAPKVTLKSDWLVEQQHQQPQQLTLKESVDNSWKEHATCEGEEGVRDGAGSATEVEIAARKLVRLRSGR